MGSGGSLYTQTLFGVAIRDSVVTQCGVYEGVYVHPFKESEKCCMSAVQHSSLSMKGCICRDSSSTCIAAYISMFSRVGTGG